MSRVGCHHLRILGLVLISAFASCIVRAQAPHSSGRAIEFSEPRSEVTATNLDEPVKRKPLRSLDDAVRKPYDVFNRSDSFLSSRPPAPPPNQPNLKNRRVRELIQKKIERDREWMYMTAEEIYGIESPEEMMNITEFGEDGLPKNSKSRLEQYYDRMQQKDAAGNTNQVNRFSLTSENADETDPFRKPNEDERRSIFAPAPPQNELTHVVAPPETKSDSSPFTPPPSTEKQFADFFGFSRGDDSKSIQRTPAQEARFQEFREKILTPSSPVSSAFSAPSTFTPPVTAPAFSVGGFGDNTFKPATPAPSPAPSLAPSLPSFSAAPVTPSLTPSYTPPPPAARPFAAPKFELPQRKF